MIAINDLTLSSNEMTAVAGGAIQANQEKFSLNFYTKKTEETALSIYAERTNVSVFPWLLGLPGYPVLVK